MWVVSAESGLSQASNGNMGLKSTGALTTRSEVLWRGFVHREGVLVAVDHVGAEK